MACARGISVMALLAALPFSQVSAEITLDGTMGPAGPLAGPNFTISDTLGTTRGATFTGPAGLDNVISRVTGGTPSSIDGLFRSTVPGADVYFINPAGVIFGQNASLDVQGAFHTTTADELRFADGNVFSASNPLATVLTAAAPPAAFGFLGANPANIAVNDSTLAVPVGETLSMVGGNVIAGGRYLHRKREYRHRFLAGLVGQLGNAAGDIGYGRVHVDDAVEAQCRRGGYHAGWVDEEQARRDIDIASRSAEGFGVR
jgi:filamentous hemagglutinin family protein